MQATDSTPPAFAVAYKAKHFVCLFLAFFTITFLVYLPALHSKFVADFMDMVYYIGKRPSLFDFSHGILFDFINWFVFKTWLRLFGYNALAWHFLQCFLHSMNAILFYVFSITLLRHFQFKHSGRLSLLIALCFVLSPYHTEPVVWGGDINYLLVGSFIFLHLLAFVLFLQYGKKKYALVATLALIAGAFTHELAWFLLPADLIVAVLWSSSLRDIFSMSLVKYVAVGMVAMALYFVNKMFSGNLVGHYGSSVHLNFKPVEIIPAFYKYILKIIFLSGFSPVSFLNKLYERIDKPVVSIALTCSLVFVIILFFIRSKKLPRLRVVICLFLLFALFIFPVLNLYFPYWIKIQGDRYCYITSAFLLASGITALYLLRPAVAILFSAGYLIASVYFLHYNVESWHRAGIITAQLEKNYRWQNAPRVYILNLPDDYRGAYMYRKLSEPNAFAQSFIKYGNGPLDAGKVTGVLTYNLNSPTDSVQVEVIQPDQLKVTLSTWGIWWWHETLGATDYEDSLLKVHIADEYRHSYIVQFKQKQPGDVFLYCANGNWQQVRGF